MNPSRISLLRSSFRLVRYNLRLAVVGGGGLLCMASAPLFAQSVNFNGSKPSVNFGDVNLCSGKNTPAPCRETLTLSYKVTESGTLGPIQVVAGRSTASVDFTLASGSTCTGTVTAGDNCVVKVTFAPTLAGGRAAAVLLTGESGAVLATTPIYGAGIGPQIVVTSGGLLLEPGIGAQYPSGLAVDNSRNLFVAQQATEFPADIQELPAGATSQISLPADGLVPSELAVDSAGDVFFLAESNSVYGIYELPAGGGDPVSVPFTGEPYLAQLAVDGAGDLFITDRDGQFDGSDAALVELPFGCRSSGCQKTLLHLSDTYGGMSIDSCGLAADTAGDVFLLYCSTLNSDSEILTELPAGASSPITLASGSELNPIYALAGVDGVGDLFFLTSTLLPDTSIAQINVVELPAGGTTLLTLGSDLDAQGGPFAAVDPAGDVFFIDYEGQVDELPRSQPALLDFGTAAVDTTSTLSLAVTNTGNRTLTVASSFVGSDSYKIAGMMPDNCLATIPSSGTCTLGIAYSPMAIGLDDASLSLETNAGKTLTVSLNGAGIVFPPVLSLPSGVYATTQSVSITDPAAAEAICYTTDSTTPTTSSKRYTGPISITGTERLNAIAFAGGLASPVTTAAYTIQPATTGIINFTEGFLANQTQRNGSAYLDGNYLTLTNAGSFNQAGSTFYNTPIDIQSFTTGFTFQLTSPDADGITFTIQNAGKTALGAAGKSLGYAPMGKSVAIKFDLFNNAGEGQNSTGLYIDGALPTVPAIDLTGTGINLHSGNVILAGITYNGTDLVLTLTDTVTLASWSHSFPIDIPKTVGANTAYVGFTGGTGSLTAMQQILTWTYIAGTPGTQPPAPPSAKAFPAPFFPEPLGFATASGPVGLITNGSASTSGSDLQLTDGGQFESGSAFFATPINIQSFTTDFTFQELSISYPPANGITFTIQNDGTNALGAQGYGLGYAGIGKSVAVKFDLRDTDHAEKPSTGIYVNGAFPTEPESYLTGINLLYDFPINAHITYDGATLNMVLTDTVNQATYSQSFPIDIPAVVGGKTAYVGFTGGTGMETAVQQINSWTFANP